MASGLAWRDTLPNAMPDPTIPECIDRASALIRAAATAPSEAERLRLLEGAEGWLQLAKRQLLGTSSPPPPPRS
jgi:hypothetical protein